MGNNTKQSRLDTLFVLIIFCVFAGSVLVALTMGASAYRGTLEISSYRFAERTGLFYIWTKTKNFDEYGRIFVEPFFDTTALVLEEDIAGNLHRTYIFYRDGFIMELFTRADSEYSLSDGIPVLNLAGGTLSFQHSQNAIIITDSLGSLIISPRTG
ncbi:MAG: DUF4860 domain-containing protein [Turicibacter sp.]|nr:DUF4860 domain-containing protein [Turicibacter sp.]